jgi:prepilin-type N-terminal cleavage/methylation domain-containing protein
MFKIENPKNQKGFTLVEVIVVAIIVAALAAVAIPVYTSYVSNSRNNAAANAAGSIASFMGACVNQGGTITTAPDHDGTDTASVTCTAGNARITLPRNIEISISNVAASGTVTARHVDSDTGSASRQVYNY